MSRPGSSYVGGKQAFALRSPASTLAVRNDRSPGEWSNRHEAAVRPELPCAKLATLGERYDQNPLAAIMAVDVGTSLPATTRLVPYLRAVAER